ncbi:MAG: GNAT family N-acetyltransferase [Oscillospiraceae bacterium]|jgi:predicted acetyltransferase|nr:GNAT family N-acetyltransferase [Oscillospiraceae bacterium]
MAERNDVTMEFRILTEPEEIIQFEQICSMVFFTPMEEKERYKPVKGQDVWGAVEDGKVISVVIATSFTMTYHGKQVPMFGIGGVGTRMEYRRKGYIRTLFHAIFDVMREKGYAFSYLYPFSNRYYSQFGYSPGMMRTEAGIPISLLESYSCDCDVHMYEPGDSFDPYVRIYERFAKSYTGMVRRDDWARLDGYVPTKNRKYMYLFTRKGVPVAFLGFQAEGANAEKRIMKVLDIAWIDMPAFFSILGFAGGSGVYYKALQISLPSSLPIELLTPEPHDLTIKQCQYGQSRIIDVRQALEGYPWPKYDGQIAIRVTDDYFEANSGIWTITFGASGVDVTHGGGDWDLDVDIRVLNLLLFGTCGFADLPYLSGSGWAAKGDGSALAQIFVKRPLYIADYF